MSLIIEFSGDLSLFIGLDLKADFVSFLQLPFIIPKWNGKVASLGESFVIVFPVVEEGEFQRLTSIGVLFNSLIDEMAYMSLVLHLKE